MNTDKHCNNKKCKHVKNGMCRNRKFKSFMDFSECEKRVICICRLEDSPVVKTEVDVGTGSMTLEHCAECGCCIKSYPSIALEPPYQRLKTLIESSLKKAIKDRIIAENNNDHAGALELNGACRALLELSNFTEYIKGVVMNQQELSEKTGIAQGDVSKILKSIREWSFVPKRVRKVLDALGWTIEINKN